MVNKNEWNHFNKEVDKQKVKQKIYDDILINFCSKDCKNNIVFDYGCGTGKIAKRLGQIALNIEAYDESEEMRKSALEKLGTGVYDKYEEIPKDKYNTILSSLVLYVVDNLEAKRIVEQIYASLKSQGTAYL